MSTNESPEVSERASRRVAEASRQTEWEAPSNLAALLSAHQSIGVPQPLKMFGTDELKKKYLPRCAAGEISAFALTEPEVGSDPARVATTAVRTADGSASRKLAGA
jgi:alkylation response protein AidB-like acyl-CoA dehydrogenase